MIFWRSIMRQTFRISLGVYVGLAVTVLAVSAIVAVLMLLRLIGVSIVSII